MVRPAGHSSMAMDGTSMPTISSLPRLLASSGHDKGEDWFVK